MSTTTRKDKADFSFGLKGYGSVRITGTEDFVGMAVKKAAPLYRAVLAKWLQARQAAGLTRAQARNEFNAAFDEAKRNIKTRKNGKKNFAIRVVRPKARQASNKR